MRKASILIFSLFVFFNARSQNIIWVKSSSILLNKDSIIGDTIKIDYDGVYSLSYAFYSNLADAQLNYKIPVLYPSIQYNFVTDKEKLKDIIFKIDNTQELSNKYILWLRDIKTNATIYYAGNSLINFPFLFKRTKDIMPELPTSNTVLNEAHRAEETNLLEIKKDDFSGNTEINTLMSIGTDMMPIIMYKTIRGKNVSYKLMASGSGSTYLGSAYGNGFSVIFTDGTKSNWSAKAEQNSGSNGFFYQVYFTPSQTDLIKFSTKKIKKMKIYIDEVTLTDEQSILFRNAVKSIVSAKKSG